MLTKMLLNKRHIDVLHQLWEQHALPIDIHTGTCVKEMVEITFDHEEEDKLLVDWLVERSTCPL